MKDVEAANGLKTHILRNFLLQIHSEIFTYKHKLNLSFKKKLFIQNLIIDNYNF